ncbi:MAG: methionine synthase [Endomicrobiia bacterium]
MTLLITTIGSLPYNDPKKALEILLKYTPDIPAWPQLPKRSFLENMYVQYSENFPGGIIDKNSQKIYVDTQKAYSGLERFYENFLTNNIDYFSISPEYASGFHQLISKLTTNNLKLKTIKCQATGPITFGLAIKDENNQSIFYNEQLRDAVIKHITMKSVWQIKQLSFIIPYLSSLILFLDEPYLASYGSAFTAISREEIIFSLQEVISGIRNSFNSITQSLKHLSTLYIGVHCCANTDWSILLETDIDILSFDAYEFFDNLILYSEKIKSFIERGGKLAWGIVPTSEEYLKNENSKTLIEKLKNKIEQLNKKNIDIKKITEQILITPACGLGIKTEETAELALFLLSELTKFQI